jgi:ubiquinone/menaquinone biosynthesis C-methylase UbiE
LVFLVHAGGAKQLQIAVNADAKPGAFSRRRVVTFSVVRCIASAGSSSYREFMNRSFRFTIMLLVVGPFAAEAQQVILTNRYETRAVHDPNGIGKFYMGREIAHVMGHQAADWFERPEREEEEKTSRLVEALKFKPGEMVADIGAGTGYLTRRIAPRILPKGRVFAVDIQPEMLDLLTNRLAGQGITNVAPVLGTVKDPRLPPRTLDTIVMADVYHEFDFPFEMTEAMCRALKPGGRLVFVEFRAEDQTVPIKRVHKMSETQVKREMAPHPLVWKETISALPWQHVIVFTRK